MLSTVPRKAVKFNPSLTLPCLSGEVSDKIHYLFSCRYVLKERKKCLPPEFLEHNVQFNICAMFGEYANKDALQQIASFLLNKMCIIVNVSVAFICMVMCDIQSNVHNCQCFIWFDLVLQRMSDHFVCMSVLSITTNWKCRPCLSQTDYHKIMSMHHWNYTGGTPTTTIPTFGNHCLSMIGGGKQQSHLVGWVQLSAEAAPGPHGVPPAPPCAENFGAANENINDAEN